VAGLALFALDYCWLEPGQKVLKTLGAKMQERFDCTVLDLPWRADRHGAEPTPEEIVRWSRKHPSTAGLRDWYSPVVGRLPLDLARVACQRASGVWNASMRRRYADALVAVAVGVALLLVALAYGTGRSVEGLLTALATLLPLGRWTLREQKSQRESAGKSERVRDRATRLWRRLLDGDGDADVEEVRRDARELQNDVYDQRKGDQQLFAFVYRRFRDRDEEEMQVAAEALVAEYERHANRWKPLPSLGLLGS
jgi:hypothetical protein